MQNSPFPWSSIQPAFSQFIALLLDFEVYVSITILPSNIITASSISYSSNGQRKRIEALPEKGISKGTNSTPRLGPWKAKGPEKDSSPKAKGMSMCSKPNHNPQKMPLGVLLTLTYSVAYRPTENLSQSARSGVRRTSRKSSKQGKTVWHGKRYT